VRERGSLLLHAIEVIQVSLPLCLGDSLIYNRRDESTFVSLDRPLDAGLVKASHVERAEFHVEFPAILRPSLSISIRSHGEFGRLEIRSELARGTLCLARC